MENKPKQKAIELYHKFYDIQINPNPLTAAKCALILCDEIIKNGFNPHLSYNYWEEVKEEIEKIKTR